MKQENYELRKRLEESRELFRKVAEYEREISLSKDEITRLQNQIISSSNQIHEEREKFKATEKQNIELKWQLDEAQAYITQREVHLNTAQANMAHFASLAMNFNEHVEFMKRKNLSYDELCRLVVSLEYKVR